MDKNILYKVYGKNDLNEQIFYGYFNYLKIIEVYQLHCLGVYDDSDSRTDNDEFNFNSAVNHLIDIGYVIT